MSRAFRILIKNFNLRCVISNNAKCILLSALLMRAKLLSTSVLVAIICKIILLQADEPCFPMHFITLGSLVMVLLFFFIF